MKRNLKKQISLLTVSGLMLCSLAACGGGGSAAPSAAPSVQPSAPVESQSTQEELKIGILIPGSPTDGGFSQQAAEAGELLRQQFDCHVAVVEAGTADAIKSEGETMAAEGYQIVFGHGGQCSAPLAEIRDDYPETWFVTTGGTEVGPNQFPVSLCLEQSTYVAGVIAGMMTQTDVIGCSVGGDYPAYTKTTNAFELGAKSVNPDINVMFAVLSAPDVTEGYETTLNQIQMGADFIYSNTNEGQAGAIKAVGETEGVYGFGSLGNFIPLAPDSVVGNTMGDWSKAFINATRAILNNEIDEPQILYLDVSNDSVSFDWNEDIKKDMPREVLDKVEETIRDIASGAIHVPNEYELG